MKVIKHNWRNDSLSPFFANNFDQVFDSFFENTQKKDWSLACDIEETDEYVLFSFDLPGLEEKDINIEIKESLLVISGEKKEEVLAEKAKTFRGRQYGKFNHHFRLHKSVDRDKVEANYSHGVLKVLLPKLEKEQPRKVELKSEKGHFFKKLLQGSDS